MSRARGDSRASSAAPTRWRRSRTPWHGRSTARGGGGGIGVVGGPGVGKSRLCHELTERARAQGVRVHSAHCVAHGKMIPFLPVLELMRDFFGITERDGDEAGRRKIAGTLLLLDQALTDDLPLVFDFLGVADPADPPLRMAPEARQRPFFRVD